MDESLLLPQVQEFITKNVGADISRLAFAKNPFPDVDYKAVLNQISAKTKAKSKLPTWFSANEIIYPSKVSVEQTSSEKTAGYKAQLVSGERLIDLTGGFGVDDYYFSKQVKQVTHCEIDPELSQIAQHNFKMLNAANINCECADSSEILKQSETRFDWIYVDPSRRHDAKGKVFMLADCVPNVPSLLDFYFYYSDNILIKAAPILDITSAVSELRNVREIHIVAVDNEVKELLFVLSKGFLGNPGIFAVNLTAGNTQTFLYHPDKDDNAPEFSLPADYLYEPNAAIMKSGAFDAVSTRFGLGKLHKHSHLYTSDSLLENFPGRVFKIDRALDYNKENMKQWLAGKQANVSVRNFPDTVEALRKKWKISDGGNVFCFFTTVSTNDKIVLLCAKIKK